MIVWRSWRCSTDLPVHRAHSWMNACVCARRAPTFTSWRTARCHLLDSCMRLSAEPVPGSLVSIQKELSPRVVAYQTNEPDQVSFSHALVPAFADVQPLFLWLVSRSWSVVLRLFGLPQPRTRPVVLCTCFAGPHSPSTVCLSSQLLIVSSCSQIGALSPSLVSLWPWVLVFGGLSASHPEQLASPASLNFWSQVQIAVS